MFHPRLNCGVIVSRFVIGSLEKGVDVDSVSREEILAIHHHNGGPQFKTEQELPLLDLVTVKSSKVIMVV